MLTKGWRKVYKTPAVGEFAAGFLWFFNGFVIQEPMREKNSLWTIFFSNDAILPLTSVRGWEHSDPHRKHSVSDISRPRVINSNLDQISIERKPLLIGDNCVRVSALWLALNGWVCPFVKTPSVVMSAISVERHGGWLELVKGHIYVFLGMVSQGQYILAEQCGEACTAAVCVVWLKRAIQSPCLLC